MMRKIASQLVLASLAWLLAAPASLAQSPPPRDSRQVRTTILRGTPPTPPAPPPVQVLPSGDITLNFPGVDVGLAAKAILGDTLGLVFTIDPSVHAQVTVVTPHPIRRADVLGFFEQTLANAGLALTSRNGTYAILPTSAARGQAPVLSPGQPGYGNETIVLKFVNAEQMRKLLDPLVPNAVSAADPATNSLIISGDSVQRRALRELIAQFDVDWLKGMSFALYVPERTDARLIAPELEKLLNAPGAPTAGLVRLIAMDKLNGILAISSQPQYLEDVSRFVEILDREGESSQRAVFVYQVQNGRAADLAKVLSSAFGVGLGSSDATGVAPPELADRTNASNPLLTPAPNIAAQGARSMPGDQGSVSGRPPVGSGAAEPEGATTITADETNNAIVVYATPRSYALIEDALRKLDVPPLQVMIDASISEVSLNHNLQYGLQWSFSAGNSSAALTQGATSTPVQNFPGFSYLYEGMNVQATLNALKTVTDVTVLSAPKLVVLNNHTASIEVGDQVPVSTGSALNAVGSINSIDYRDTGIILKITPRVNASGLVLLDIAQEVSDVLPQSSAQSGSSLNSPTIEQRKIATSVAVRDGETIALGGLIKNRVTRGRSTIPLLGDVPVLGHLFGDTTEGLERTELVVLLTPRVVRTPVDAAAITAELRDRIHLAAPPPPVGH